MFGCFANDTVVVADYFDRRAQARYAAENPNSSLNAAEGPGFASKLADPTYNTQGGGIIGTLTGGTVGGGRRGRRAERRAAKGDGRIVHSLLHGPANAPKPGQLGYQPQGVKRLMQQDVLYLTIVNMPTDDELQMAVATMQSIQDTK